MACILSLRKPTGLDMQDRLGNDLGLDIVRYFPTRSPCCSGQITRESLDTLRYREVSPKRRVRTLLF
jgi:hypothetical protein